MSYMQTKLIGLYSAVLCFRLIVFHITSSKPEIEWPIMAVVVGLVCLRLLIHLHTFLWKSMASRWHSSISPSRAVTFLYFPPVFNIFWFFFYYARIANFIDEQQDMISRRSIRKSNVRLLLNIVFTLPAVVVGKFVTPFSSELYVIAVLAGTVVLLRVLRKRIGILWLGFSIPLTFVVGLVREDKSGMLTVTFPLMLVFIHVAVTWFYKNNENPPRPARARSKRHMSMAQKIWQKRNLQKAASDRRRERDYGEDSTTTPP